MRLFILNDEGRIVFDSDDPPEMLEVLPSQDRLRVLVLINTVLKFLLGIE